MRRFIIILTCMLSVSFHAYSHNYYYWYQGRQIPLRQGSRFYIIYDAKESKGADSLQVIEGGYLSLSKEVQLKWGIVSEQTLANAKNVLYQMTSFVSSDSTQDMYVTHRFYVKLKQQNDTILLHRLVEQYQAVIETQGDLPLWYIIRCGLNSQQNALSLANIFYESGLFEVAEPEFINAVHVDCVNDPMFSQQWNLKNTGQWLESYSGIDINYCDAHAITSGNASTIIGVYDLGVDLTHPDINLYSFSYDVNSLSSPSSIYTINGSNYHGTACAGIISAKTDNNLGVAGIAPDCPIMSLSFANSTTNYNMGIGFKIAADNGCSVISNSWNRSSYSSWIDECIRYALINGRNGKGCVIVFSAGNNDRDSINYPANSNDSIIVVGAMSPCGQRCNPYSCDGYNWGSNYGTKLDVMAPGVLIRTTDIVGVGGDNSSNYINDFMGTSAACPHVAAVAGLILSVNPFLTQKEVVDIIESTAQKVGIDFNSTPNRPNGTWSYNFGYGLVDAYASVMEAQSRCPKIQGPDYVCDTTMYYLQNLLPDATINWEIHNGELMHPWYSIVGPSNQDTVYVRCEYVIPMLDTRELDNNITDLSAKGGFVDVGKWLTATMTEGSTSTTFQKDFRLPLGEKPTISASSSAIWYSNTPRTFTITNCLSVPDSALQWKIVKKTIYAFGMPSSSVTLTYTGRSVTYSTKVPLAATCQVTISATNTFKECKDKTTTLTYTIVRPNQFQTNIINSILNVDMSEFEDYDNYTLELWNSMHGCIYNRQVQSANEQVNIEGLLPGVYVLLLKENGEVIAQEKVLIQ